MSSTRFLRCAPVVAALIACSFGAGSSLAADAAAKSPRPAAKARSKAPPAPVALTVPDAQPEQMKAAEMVFYGGYDCEFQQTVSINQSPKHSGYVDVKHGKSNWLMKPVLSSTGAIRLEDVRGETLMVQIATKSMLLNVKTGHRVVDDCVCPKQLELVAEAKAAKAAGQAGAPPAPTLLK